MDGRRSQGYKTLGKRERGLIRAYAEKVTGFSVSQMTRLIRRYRDTDRVRETAQDIALLAQVDRAHGRLSGPATCAILRREPQQFGQKEYARLAEISVAHLYTLRHSARYRNQAAVYEPTRSTSVAIGERRKPWTSSTPST